MALNGLFFADVPLRNYSLTFVGLRFTPLHISLWETVLPESSSWSRVRDTSAHEFSATEQLLMTDRHLSRQLSCGWRPQPISVTQRTSICQPSRNYALSSFQCLYLSVCQCARVGVDVCARNVLIQRRRSLQPPERPNSICFNLLYNKMYDKPTTNDAQSSLDLTRHGCNIFSRD